MENVKKSLIMPEIEIINLQTNDIIVTSELLSNMNYDPNYWDVIN